MEQLNKKLAKELRNKKVCFVGPANTLVDVGAGEEIDKFDLVVRTNGSCFMDPEYIKDYGSKTDIVYVNNAYLKRRIGMANTTDKKIKNLIKLVLKYDAVGIRYIVVKGYRTEKLFKSAIKAYNKVKNRNVDITPVMSSRVWKTGNRSNIWAKAKNTFFEPTLAVYAISDIVYARPNLLYVTGMDFYTGASHWFGSYNETVDQKKEELDRRKKHHLLADMEYMNELKKSCKYIRYDSVINHFLD